MANTLLTPTQVTRKSLLILHQKLNFVGRVNRSYDDSYAQEGAKIGDSLKIRLPNEYTVTDGATLDVQDTTENSVTLQVNNRKHVGMSFSTQELTMDIDDFSERHLEPAMARLAAKVESDVLKNVYKDVYQQVNNVGSACTIGNVLGARKKLVDALAPLDRTLTFTMATQTNVDLVDGGKALFNDPKILSKQYREGLVGDFSGFTFFENTHIPAHTAGTDANGYQVNGANQTGSTLTINTGSGTFVKGDVITIADVYRVHPETKETTNDLQQFVVTATTGTSATSVAISPAITTSGASQTVNASPANGAAITKVGGNAAVYDVNLAFHRDAFAFATADIKMPKAKVWGHREAYDGISLRLISDYNITNDTEPCRIDVLFGYKTIRAQLAARVATN